MSDKFQQLHFICILQIRISGRGIPGIFGTMYLHTLLILWFLRWCQIVLPAPGADSLVGRYLAPRLMFLVLCCVSSSACSHVCSLLFKLPVSSPPAAADRCFQPLPDRSNAPSAGPCSPQTSPTDHADAIKTPLTASQSLFLPLGPRYKLATQILCLCSFKNIVPWNISKLTFGWPFHAYPLQKKYFLNKVLNIFLPMSYGIRFCYVFVSSYFYAINFSCSVNS